MATSSSSKSSNAADITSYVKKVTSAVTKDGSALAAFKANPTTAVKGILGNALSAGTIKNIIAQVKDKISITSILALVKALGGKSSTSVIGNLLGSLTASQSGGLFDLLTGSPATPESSNTLTSILGSVMGGAAPAPAAASAGSTDALGGLLGGLLGGGATTPNATAGSGDALSGLLGGILGGTSTASGKDDKEDAGSSLAGIGSLLGGLFSTDISGELEEEKPATKPSSAKKPSSSSSSAKKPSSSSSSSGKKTSSSSSSSKKTSSSSSKTSSSSSKKTSTSSSSKKSSK